MAMGAEADHLKHVEEDLVRLFDGRLPRERISAELARVLPAYEHARVRQYVPLLVRREIIKALGAPPADSPAPGPGEGGLTARR